ncbi:MAG: TetR family transcriptional regulator [Desulfobacterales bacterium]|nr:MAG: TetR family transcriptional regulator [Desulfobacterales bacterium]UCD88471.1 MAG: TetR family transcriptional regulator [Desulfobacterales bacterium]
MASKKRAISEEDKKKRKDKILKTAWKLYRKADGQIPTVSVIAQKTGLSKGTVYLYFKTKDEIFLQLYLHKLREWHESVAAKLQHRTGKISVTEFAKITTDYVVNNPLLLKMGSIARGVLEENTDDRVIIDTKMQIAQLLEDCSQLTCQIFPGLTIGQAVKIHLRIYALIFGLWQITSSPPNVRRMLKKAKIEIFEPDFSESVVESVATFLKGALP